MGTPPRNFEILQALKYMFWGFWGSFSCLHTVHIYLCGALASGLRSSHIRECVHYLEICVSSILSKKSWLTWNQQCSETNPLKKLDWDANDEPDLIWTSLGALLHRGPRANSPSCPPLSTALVMNAFHVMQCISVSYTHGTIETAFVGVAINYE